MAHGCIKRGAPTIHFDATHGSRASGRGRYSVYGHAPGVFELSAKMQDLLKQLSARHDPVGHYLYLSGQKALHELPSGHHPIVRQIPETGDVALYVNEGFTRGIDGLAESESKFLLRFLFDTIRASVPAQIRVKWQPDTIVFWDNRLVQHHAVFDYFPHRRLGYRATVRGEAPIAA